MPSGSWLVSGLRRFDLKNLQIRNMFTLHSQWLEAHLKSQSSTGECHSIAEIQPNNLPFGAPYFMPNNFTCQKENSVAQFESLNSYFQSLNSYFESLIHFEA